jgi:hypothetical protein
VRGTSAGSQRQARRADEARRPQRAEASRRCAGHRPRSSHARRGRAGDEPRPSSTSCASRRAFFPHLALASLPLPRRPSRAQTGRLRCSRHPATQCCSQSRLCSVAAGSRREDAAAVTAARSPSPTCARDRARRGGCAVDAGASARHKRARGPGGIARGGVPTLRFSQHMALRTPLLPSDSTASLGAVSAQGSLVRLPSRSRSQGQSTRVVRERCIAAMGKRSSWVKRGTG